MFFCVAELQVQVKKNKKPREIDEICKRHVSFRPDIYLTMELLQKWPPAHSEEWVTVANDTLLIYGKLQIEYFMKEVDTF